MEHFDVLIVGAGLSGIGAGAHFRLECPDKTFAVLEGREAMGGTWDLFRYPGIRSDSDMYTLGYRFRPWNDPKAIADGPSILEYIKETAREYDLDKEIRYGHRVKKATWSSVDARWSVEAEISGGETALFTCSFLYLCTGYYDYNEGYTPEWPGADRFKGEMVHPQKWPEGLDYEGKEIVVIGSGATAVTLVPALAEKAKHVTMLQRSPTYILSIPAKDRIANFFRAALPSKAAYALSRWKNVLIGMVIYTLSRRRPSTLKRFLVKGVEKELGKDALPDFTPTYNPWDQRLCLVPDSDLFESIREGKSSVVTDTIKTFTETGIELESGKRLEADIVVTATGLVLKLMAGLQLVVDGEPVELSETLTYKGMMYSGVPNLASALGYTNASWTLKCDLTSEYVCRLIRHMDRNGFDYCVPKLHDPSIERVPAIDFNSGYVLRALDELPSQGTKMPWKLHQNYFRDLAMLRYARLEDDAMEFNRNPERKRQYIDQGPRTNDH
ncbi:MAG: NAD(P)/FAD-dependent oxidoreductase [Acidobacteriota bacterium]|nr:MAG: NAD(P)/FAD-dependent oxidoreductase [Acidobacteriota bacterium]